MAQFDGDNIVLILGPATALMLIGHLQLALLHPGNVGTAAEAAQVVIRSLTPKVAERSTDPVAVKWWIELGNPV